MNKIFNSSFLSIQRLSFSSSIASSLSATPMALQELYAYRANPHFHITKAQLDALIQSGSKEYRLLDVREPHEFATGLIPTAEKIPMGQITQHFPPHSTDAQEAPSEDCPDLICYCRSGSRSQRVMMYLRQNGYRAFNYPGSFLEYFPDRSY